MMLFVRRKRLRRPGVWWSAATNFRERSHLLGVPLLERLHLLGVSALKLLLLRDMLLLYRLLIRHMPALEGLRFLLMALQKCRGLLSMNFPGLLLLRAPSGLSCLRLFRTGGLFAL